jgi:primosomal protein N' (replication factor Y) (superfamily II helicase)
VEKKTFFVDVILPLAIPNLLTYRVPQVLNEVVQAGQRVVVQLGKAKLYTALVRSVHENPPATYQAKYLEGVLDEFPIVNEYQFKLWEWAAAYYMCTAGEVMNAALPSSLKLASETKVVLNDEWDGVMDGVDERAILVVEALQVQEVLSLKEIADLLELKNVQPLIKHLLEKGMVMTEEELQQRYKPRLEDFVLLTEQACHNDFMQDIFDTLEKRAPKQLDLLMAFFHLTGSDDMAQREVSRIKLQNHVGATSTLTKKLEERGVFTIVSKPVDRLQDAEEASAEMPQLSPDQQVALGDIKSQFKTHDVVLLHGVTGSGKTELYVRLINEALERGEQVLYLLPEIALTTQLINRLRKFFGERVGVYHSKFNQNERVEIWRDVAIRDGGKYSVVLGPRSALFLPFSNLGLVVVDEEHENSFKQFDPSPRYHGRDLALVLAKLHKAKVVLGSATPSVETNWHANEGRYGLVQLNKRFSEVAMPEIQCADLRQELSQKTMKGIFSSILYTHIEAALEAKEQIILFQNRRGYSPLWQCKMCGDVPQCKRCDVSLTYHKISHQLKCHYCGYATNPPKECTVCGSHDLRMLGSGTERIEEEVKELFPNAVVERMDLDTTRSKHAYERILTDFENGMIDILVGTQMVSKGLDFNNVSLVGVLNADHMINFPDFRSFERAFQLMLQVAGRAGRQQKRGKVIVQTYSPNHWVIQRVMAHDYQGLYDNEIVERRNFYYPPFYRLIKLTLKHKELNILIHAAAEFGKALKEQLGERVLGPETPLVARIRNQYLRTLLIKVERDVNPSHAKKIIQDQIRDFNLLKDYKSVKIVADVDPV